MRGYKQQYLLPCTHTTCALYHNSMHVRTCPAFMFTIVWSHVLYIWAWLVSVLCLHIWSTMRFYSAWRLIQDREISLMDGTRLVGEERYQKAMEASGLTPESMAERWVLRACSGKCPPPHMQAYVPNSCAPVVCMFSCMCTYTLLVTVQAHVRVIAYVCVHALPGINVCNLFHLWEHIGK